MSPNQGFWRSLCAFEEQLGITQRQAACCRSFKHCHRLPLASHPSPCCCSPWTSRCVRLLRASNIYPLRKAELPQEKLKAGEL